MGRKGQLKGPQKKEDDSEVTKARDESPAGIISSIGRSVRGDVWVQLLVGLTVIGAIIRFYHLDFNSLWLDEAFTYDASKGSLMEIWNTMEVGDFHPPLFHWIEHFMLAFGHSEFVLRFIPALLGVCTIPLFFFVGKELVDERIGVLSATLLTFSPFHIYYSQEAYSYSAVLFTFSLVLYCYLRALRTRERTYWLLCGVFSALSFWIHFYTLIPVFFVYLHALMGVFPERRKGWEAFKNIFYSVITIIILISPLIPIVIQRYLSLTARPPTYGVLGPALISESFIRFSAFSLPVTILFVLLFVAGTLYLYRVNRHLFWLWVMMISLPLLLSVILSSKMTMNPRYLIFLLTFFYPGIACSYLWVRQYSARQWIVLVFIAAFILLNTPTLVSYYQGYSKENWRGLATIMETNTMPGDSIILVPGYLEMPFTYYYNNSSDQTRVFGAASVAELENIARLHGENRTFYIVTGDIMAANPEGDVIRWLEKNTSYKGEYTNIYIFSSP
ncbi:MAG: glycosyltransferase family 39 protein [Methanolinea sp.]|nr:glycosyltransferase family 39 protein [Methanolinea sp.]